MSGNTTPIPLQSIPQVVLIRVLRRMDPLELFIFFSLSKKNQQLVADCLLTATFGLTFYPDVVEISVDTGYSTKCVFRVETKDEGMKDVECVKISEEDPMEFDPLGYLEPDNDWTDLFVFLSRCYNGTKTDLDTIIVDYDKIGDYQVPSVDVYGSLEEMRKRTKIEAVCNTLHFRYPTSIRVSDRFLHIVKINCELEITCFPQLCPLSLLSIPRLKFLKAGFETPEDIIRMQFSECVFVSSNLYDHQLNQILHDWVHRATPRSFYLEIGTKIPMNSKVLEASLNVRDKKRVSEHGYQFALVRKDKKKALVKRGAWNFIMDCRFDEHDTA